MGNLMKKFHIARNIVVVVTFKLNYILHHTTIYNHPHFDPSNLSAATFSAHLFLGNGFAR